jgi:hypothetical protein
MFKGKTAFIIGAGTGVDIHMPTGKELIEEIEKRLTFRVVNGQRGLTSERLHVAVQQASARHKIETQLLLGAGVSIAKGAHHMGSIDTYIHAHSHDENIKMVGKMAIIDVILDSELHCDVSIDWTKYPFDFKNDGRARKSWLAVLMNSLVQGIVAKENLDNIFDNIAIINFNYDRCVEQYFHKSLQLSFGVTSERAAELITSKLVIHHPYGKIADLIWEAHNGLHLGGDPHDRYNVDLELLSHNIRTFNEEVEGSPKLDECKRFLSEARNVVFLGFHFHDQNVALISPHHAQRTTTQHVYASTFGRSPPEKERIAGQVGEMLGPPYSLAQVHLDIEDCRQLLADYGTTIVARV